MQRKRATKAAMSTYPLRCFAIGLTFIVAVSDVAATQLIVNAQLADGTGAPMRSAAVRIDGELIVAVGALTAGPKDEVIDAQGHVLAPGFIDTHSHHDWHLDSGKDAESAISQGITTIVVGQDGSSQYPLAHFFDERERNRASVNIASYVGHGSLRREILGVDFRRTANPEELEKLKRLLSVELAAGALGLSTGLEYEPGTYSNSSELIELAKVSARHGGRYISHVRSEDLQLDAALDELLRIGEEACLPVQISHMKIAMRTRWGEAPALLQKLDAARARGIDVTADVYPYEYWQSTLKVLFPNKNYTDPRAAKFALEHFAAPDGLKLSRYAPDTSLVGLTLEQIAHRRHTEPATTLIDLIREARAFSDDDSQEPTEMVIGRSMTEPDISALIAWPHTNISSDGMLQDLHPRGAGAFTRALRLYVREQRVLSLEEALHKMTALSAAHVGITDRGVIRPGAYADLVLLDPKSVSDRATIERPQLLSTGLERVWVNGQTVWRDGRATQTYPGKILRRSRAATPFRCRPPRG